MCRLLFVAYVATAFATPVPIPKSMLAAVATGPSPAPGDFSTVQIKKIATPSPGWGQVHPVKCTIGFP